MADNSEALCQQCERGFEDEEDIIGITGAMIVDMHESIIPDDQPWIALYHIDCWKTITDLIQQVLGTKKSADAKTDKTSNSGQPD